MPEEIKEPKIEKREITSELKEAYLDYAMSVIVGRALPDVRDGLKPVHRRILWAMKEDGLTHSAKFRKSANVVGSVLGRYHPHGDIAVYDALARMAQDFSLRYPLIDGQGNWGSIDGDSAAAMRYTEARLSKIAEEMLADIEKETVDFVPNYDGLHKEPFVFPTKIPNLLLNGSDGIAVGMATKIPPHNLGEVVDALIHLTDNPDSSPEELTTFIKGPDFPTGGVIYNRREINEAYLVGRGGITVRALAEVEDKRIVITEIPYQVIKAELVVKIAELVQEKKIEGIRDLRDESDKDGLRIVIDLKSEAAPQKVLNHLWSATDLQKVYHLNMLALVDGLRPQTLSLKDILVNFVGHRRIVVRRRTEFDLNQAKDRAHILEGLAKALDVIDQIISTIKKSKDKEEAHANLIKGFALSDRQATAILEMRLQTLAALERQKIEDELKEKLKLIKELTLLLKDPKKIDEVIKKELAEMKEKYGDERRTKVVEGGLKEFTVTDFVPDEETIITLSNDGYIKRLPPETFKSQKRGGKGIIGGDFAESDILSHFFRARTHDNILFFSESGKVFQTKVYEVPIGSRTSRGKAIQNFLEISGNEKISAIIAYSDAKKALTGHLFMVTKNGLVKKTALSEFKSARRNGLIAIKLKKDDELGWVKLSTPGDDILLTTLQGQAIRFKEKDVRAMGRTAAGVKGIGLRKDDRLSSANIVGAETKSGSFLVTMANGFAKLTPLKDYKTQSRGGRGILTAKVTAKTGLLISSHIILEEKELLAISERGQTIKTDLKSIRQTGRSAQGVKIMRLKPGDKVAGTIAL